LWEGGFLLTARAQGIVPSHAHHAIQVVIALDGCVAICGKDGGWRESGGIAVRADAEHSFDCNGALGVMVFVDPEQAKAPGCPHPFGKTSRLSQIPGWIRSCRQSGRSLNNQMRLKTSRHWFAAAYRA
jgi:hypothetical protein